VPKPSTTSLSAIEKNAMLYACGYVPITLLCKIERSGMIPYIKCLSKIAVAGDESSFLDYTKQWVSRIK